MLNLVEPFYVLDSVERAFSVAEMLVAVDISTQHKLDAQVTVLTIHLNVSKAHHYELNHFRPIAIEPVNQCDRFVQAIGHCDTYNTGLLMVPVQVISIIVFPCVRVTENCDTPLDNIDIAFRVLSVAE